MPIGDRAVAWVRRYVDGVRPALAKYPDAGVLFLSASGERLCAEWLTRTVRAYVKAGAPAKKGSCHTLPPFGGDPDARRRGRSSARIAWAARTSSPPRSTPGSPSKSSTAVHRAAHRRAARCPCRPTAPRVMPARCGSAVRQTGDVSIGEELLEERRRRRRAGDPRLSEAGKELFRRMTTGDLAGEFQAALDAVSDADPLLGGSDDD